MTPTQVLFLAYEDFSTDLSYISKEFHVFFGHHSLNCLQTALLDKNFQEMLNLKRIKKWSKRIQDDQWMKSWPFAIAIERVTKNSD
jgi:hypothetical protein